MVSRADQLCTGGEPPPAVSLHNASAHRSNDVAFGSKGEELSVSKSRPLSPTKLTSVRVSPLR